MPATREKSAMKKVDPTVRGVIQTGYVEDPPSRKPEPEPEELTRDQLLEKAFYQKILKKMIPDFPIKKLEKQSLADLERFFSEVSPILQEEILDRYRDLSP